MESSNPSEREQVEQAAVDLGRQLGLLLASARLPLEQKEAWLTLVPSMTPDQLQQLAVALERLVPDAQEQGFAELATKLGASEVVYSGRVAEATGEANNALDEIEAQLDQEPT